MKSLHLDYETFAAVDLKKTGAFRYANDPSCEILCAAMAIDDEEPEVFAADVDVGWCIALKYKSALLDPEVLVICHNAQFEQAVSLALMEKTWGIPCPALSRFRCTMSLARRAALPSKLEKLAEVLQLKNLKDKRGASLIRKFSIMQKAPRVSKKNPNGGVPFRIRPQDDPEAFAEFMEYCRRDVLAEQEVSKKLAYFDDLINNANYSLDAVINARGLPVNLAALRHAQTLIDEETKLVSERFRTLTGFEITQNARLLAWCQKNGFEFPNLQAETLDTWLEEQEGLIGESGIVEDALRMKQSIAYASIKKIKTMILCAGPADNRIRGLLNMHGATTGRWTHSLVQPGNFKRSTKLSELAYEDICQGVSREMLELTYGPVLEILSVAIRHFIQDLPNNIFDGDYAGIEARVVCWLAGQEDALERFRAYDRATPDQKKSLDPYRIMAADVYQIPVKEVLPFPHRFVGKSLILGAGFMLSPAGYRRQCLEQAKYDLPEGQEFHAIGLWRKRHQKVVQWWKDLDNAAKKAVARPGQIFPAGKVSFMCKRVGGEQFLLMKLPSGRNLAYPRPRIVPGKFEGTTQIEFFGNIKGTTWGACRLWPGAMANNATQATATDVMMVGAHNCENEGYEIFNVVHDQGLGYVKPGQTGKRFLELLLKMPAWCNGLPLAADGGEAKFYTKS